MIRTIVFLLATLTAAAAQTPLVRTVNLINNSTKEVVGTATFHGNRIYFRDINGAHFATLELSKDGKSKAFDPSGKPVELSTLPSLPK